MTRWAFLVFLLAVGTGVCSARSLSNITFDEEYDLFYQEQFHKLSPQVKADVPQAYEHILRLWGMEDPGGLRHPLKIQIKEVPSKTLGRWEAAYVESWGSGNTLRQTLVIDIQTYIQHPDEDLNRLITHEMSHVILMDAVAESGAAPIPPWFNEGLAQASTREGHDRVRSDIRMLAYTGLEPVLCSLDGPVDEFAHGPFNGNCYPEFYLAVQRFKQLGGPDVIQKVIRGIRQGTKLQDLMPSLVQKDWPSFKKDAEIYTAQVLGAEKPVP